MADTLAQTLFTGSLRFLPVAPGRMEFALEVRRRLLEWLPGVVAVELPVTLRETILAAVKRLPEVSIVVYEDPADADRGVYLPIEAADPLIEAVRTGLQIGAEILFLEPDVAERPHHQHLYPDSYALTRTDYERYVSAWCESAGTAEDPSLRPLAEGMAWKLQGANPEAATAVVLSFALLNPVRRAFAIPQEEPLDVLRRDGLHLANAHPDCLAEILSEHPFLQARYEQVRMEPLDAIRLDRLKVQYELFGETEAVYERETGEAVQGWQRRLFARFSRNLALTSRQLAPNLFDLAMAARGTVDDDFAYWLWETANRYPAQKETDRPPTLNLNAGDVYLNTRRMQLRRRRRSDKQRFQATGLKRRPKEKTKGEWAQQLDGSSICSYPPEDLVIEDYGKFLKSKAKSILSEERTRVEPFVTSILDGIDIRETIRNWHQRQIFVRSYEKVYGEVGSVVVIFDEDRDDRYSWMTTWLGEHQNESDMAFYSTDPYEHLVGPGIGRAEYGGLLLSLPPRRMFDVWRDPDYDHLARSKPERLLLAAIDYSTKRYVVYVAPKPPRSLFRSIASRMGRQVILHPHRPVVSAEAQEDSCRPHSGRTRKAAHREGLHSLARAINSPSRPSRTLHDCGSVSLRPSVPRSTTRHSGSRLLPPPRRSSWHLPSIRTPCGAGSRGNGLSSKNPSENSGFLPPSRYCRFRRSRFHSRLLSA
ncbi:MAG: hypothetical protein U5J83_02575 [Bryobacterales bacterium]|nr:hypothetical protein [Bryobacterales bacterium]